jgi:hypothetical protein
LGAGCDGRRISGAILGATNDVFCGRRRRVVLAPQGWRQVCETFRRRRRQQRLVSGKSAEETVKTVAQGMPVIRLYLW